MCSFIFFVAAKEMLTEMTHPFLYFPLLPSFGCRRERRIGEEDADVSFPNYIFS